MAKIWISDKLYTGLLKLDNVIDSLTTDKEKYDYLYMSLLSQNVDVSTLTEAQAVSVIDSFKTHKNRVTADGGYLLNANNTLRAIHFALVQGLSAVAYIALSLAFGYKLNAGKQLVKLYSISGALYDGIVDTPSRLRINGDYVQSAQQGVGTITIQTAIKSVQPIIASRSKFDSKLKAGTVFSRTQNTSATSSITIYEGLMTSSSGTTTGMFRAADDTSVDRPLAAERELNEKGVSLFLSDTIKSYSTAYGIDAEYSYSKPRKNMLNIAQYFCVSIGSGSDTEGHNSYFGESWFIGGNTTADLARDLAKYLNIE